MPAPVASVDALLDLIRDSGVVEAQEMDAFLATHENTAGPKALANALIEASLLTPFQAKHLLAGRKRGLMLGQYRILEQIGKGGTAQVYLAEHRKMRRKVAIKVLPPFYADDEEALSRFYREARAIAALDHPTIIKAHDVACEGDIHYLVMEYVEGTSLKDHLEKRGPLPIAEATAYIDQTLSGLQHAFERGLIHRDIKPGNLILERTGCIRILDMGLVKFFEENDDTLTRDLSKGAVLGTADYLSPEQALSCHEVDVRSDIYSIGATFYTLLAGEPPFHHSKLTQKLMDHQFNDPPPLGKRRRDVPPGLCALIMRMMAKKPEDRFQTPAEARDALAPFLTDATQRRTTALSVSSAREPARPDERATAPAQRRASGLGWGYLPWIAAASAALIVGAAGALWALK
ncbi:MAG: serine/threonine-protein kinase [Gemmataceae bacterium]